MAAPVGYRFLKRPLDRWSTRERLALASSVRRSGDQNWVSVSRAIKPFGENSRPPDWFSQKNCALQYADLLEKVDTPKRKRGEKGAEREVVDTPANQIVRKLTIERIEELKSLIQEEEKKYQQLKKEVQGIKAGQYDDSLESLLKQIQEEKKAAEERKKEEEKKLAEELAEREKANALRKGLQRPVSGSVGSLSEVDENTQDSIPEHLNVETTDDELPSTPTVSREVVFESASTQISDQKPPSSPPLLSHLLQSKQISVDSLQQIKAEAEAKQTQAVYPMEASVELAPLATVDMTPVVTTSVPQDVNQHGVSLDMIPDEDLKEEVILSDILDLTQELQGATEQVVEVVSTSPIKDEIIDCGTMAVEETVEVETHESPVKVAPPVVVKTEEIIEAPAVPEEVERSEVAMTTTEDLVSVKEEPPSPASSISSRVSETGSKSSSRKSLKGGRSSTGSRRGGRMSRKSVTDEISSRPSDGETSEDDRDSVSTNVLTYGTSAFSESIPNSPLSHCSDTEDDKSYKTWKKSIMLVWRAAANHKYANVFLHPVTDDIAPGYSSVVRRPKNLTSIKRHIENGTIRTTPEFQRDMMLMFTNAIMYNSSNHDVYKMAEEMYNDVMEHIEQYVSTQMMVQSSDTKLLRPSRRNESSDKEEDYKRRRTSSEEGGKAKKRKSRADET